MKGLFLVLMSMANMKKNIIGGYKKVIMQVEELNKYFDVEIVDCDFKRNLVKKVISRLPYTPNNFKWPSNRKMPYDVDFIYLRADECDMEIYRFLKKIKKHNPSCKIVVEYPNYPLDYDYMIKNITMIPTKYKHFHAQKILDKFVDRFVVFLGQDVDSAVPTFNIHNMLNYEKLNCRIVNDEFETINLLSVSGMMNWHRIDRLLLGLAKYYQQNNKRKVMLHLVGTGPNKDDILKLIDDLKLNDYVIYYGVKDQKELDDIYNKCDIGIEVISEKGVFSSSLKSREYWGKGLPIVTTSIFEDNTKKIERYIYHDQANNDPINIEGIIRFFDNLYPNKDIKEKQKVADEIRQFAISNYDVSIMFKPIVDYLQHGEVFKRD